MGAERTRAITLARMQSGEEATADWTPSAVFCAAAAVLAATRHAKYNATD